METKMYEMDWNAGKMVEMTKSPKLTKGQILYAYGYANALQIFAVTDPESRDCVEIRRQDVTQIEDLPEDYFSPLHRYDEYIKPIAKKFGIGFYYTENFATEEEMRQGLKRAADIDKLVDLEKQIKNDAFNAGVEICRSQYGTICTEAAGHYDSKTAANNFRALLKANFPGCKFSVTKSSYHYYSCEWTDGPTKEQVKEIAKLFDDEVPSKYGDGYESEATPFTGLYGFVIISLSRNISQTLQDTERARLESLFPDWKDEQILTSSDLFGMLGGNMPEDIADTLRGSWERWYRPQELAFAICCNRDYYTAPKLSEADNQTSTDKETATADLQYIDYSDKAFAIVGDTKPYAAKLKELGGRFNPRLSCGAGWIFSKAKNETVKLALNL